MPYIPTEEVESSNIERIGYHRKQQILRIIFQGGRAYDYPMVTEREYRDLMASESKGRFFNSRIKSMYAHRTPREVELVEPCCEHPEANPTCTEECFPCNEWCCPGAPSSTPPEVMAAAIKGGLAFGAADHSAEPPTTGSDEGLLIGGDMEAMEVPPAVPRTADGEIDMDAIPDATHLFQAGEDEKVCLHPDQNREENVDGSIIICSACGADLGSADEEGSLIEIGGGCHHGEGGRDCAEWCACKCHPRNVDVEKNDVDGAETAGDENQEEETNGSAD